MRLRIFNAIGTALASLILVAPVSYAATHLIPAGRATGPSQPVSLPITMHDDFIVVEAQNRIVISQGPGMPVVVTDLAGANPVTINALTGSGDLALSDDGTTIWTAMAGPQKIGRLNLADLTTQLYATGPGWYGGGDACPDYIFFDQGLVWFAESCIRQWHDLKVLNPATGEVTIATSPSYYDGYFFTDPRLAGRLYYDTSGLSPNSTIQSDLTGLPTPASTTLSDWWDSPDASSMGYDPVGDVLVTSSGLGLDPADILASPKVTYPAQGVVSVRDDGLAAFGNSTRLRIFETSAVPYTTYTLAGEILRTDFGATALYVLIHNTNGYSLVTITPRPSPTLTAKAPTSTSAYGQSITIAGQLGTGPTDRGLSLYRTYNSGSRTLVAMTTAGTGGEYTFKTPVRENATYEVVSNASNGYEAARATVTIKKVLAKVTIKHIQQIGHRGKYHLWPVSGKARARGQVSPNHQADCVYFRAQFYYQGRWGHDSTTSCVHLSSTSRARVYLNGDRGLLKIPFRFRTEWRGDNRNLAKTSTWLYGRFVKASGSPARAGRSLPPEGQLAAPDLG